MDTEAEHYTNFPIYIININTSTDEEASIELSESYDA